MPGEDPEEGFDSVVTAWARTALATPGEVPGVRRVGIALTEGGGRRLRFTASDRLGSDRDRSPLWCHVDAYDDVPLNTVVRTGDPVLGTLDELADQYPDFVERQRAIGTVALAAVPVVAATQTLGGVVLFFDQPSGLDAARGGLGGAGAALGAELRRAQRTRVRDRSTLADEPVPAAAAVAVHSVPPDHAAVSDARRFLRLSLAAWAVDEEVVESAVLCLSEVVTNALIHAMDGCSVRVLLEQGVLTVAVRDGGPIESDSVDLPEDLLRVHGRGLQILDALASRWGSDLDTVGTTVWFTFDASET